MEGGGGHSCDESVTQQILSVPKKNISHSFQRLRRLLMFQRPMYLDQVFFTDISCYKEGGVAHLVEALRYKPEGRGFNTRWCHWNSSLT